MENNNEVKRAPGKLAICHTTPTNIYVASDEFRDSGNKAKYVFQITQQKSDGSIDIIDYKNAEFLITAWNEYDKLKEDNAAILNILQRINNVISIPAVSKVFSHDLQIAIKKATKQASNK